MSPSDAAFYAARDGLVAFALVWLALRLVLWLAARAMRKRSDR